MPVRDMDRIVAGEALAHFGDPYPHSPIHFDDMSDQLEALFAAASPEALIVNWCGDEVITQRQWVEQAGELCGKTPAYHAMPGAPGNISDPALRRSLTGPCRRGFKESFAAIYRQKYA
jgi:hypothetical protein